MNLSKKELQTILIKINPKIKSHLNKKKIHLTNDTLLDSLMIIRLIHEIEEKTKKKIKINQINRNSFSNLDNILKFLKK